MKITLITGVITAGLFIAMATYTSPLRPSIPQLQLTFNPFDFNAIIAAWPADGIDRFRTHFAIDFPFLVCYGSLGYLICVRTSLFARFSDKSRILLTRCLPCAAGFDVIENLLHLYLVSGATFVPQAMYKLAGTVAAIKWLLIGVFVLCAVCAACGVAWRHADRGNPP